jgi:anti-anti-sigma factor
MAAQGILSVYQHEQRITFRAQGWARAAQGLALRRYGEQGMAAGVNTVWVDLRDCVHMDSTFMGTLLHLQRALRKRGQGEMSLVAPSAQCRRLLEQMGLEDVFPVVSADASVVPCWCEVRCEPESMDSFKCKVIQAHQELACLPGKAGETFREVVRGLVQDMEGKAAAGQPVAAPGPRPE